MAVQAKPLTASKETTPPQLAEVVAAVFADLIDQLNRDPLDLAAINSIVEELKLINDKIVQAIKDIVALKSTATITTTALSALQVTVTALSSSLTALTATVALKLTANSTNFKGLITSTGTGIANFPTANDWGFQNNAGTLTLRFNVSGTVKSVTLT